MLQSFRISFRRAFIALAACALISHYFAPPTLVAQVSTADIVGTVTDASSAVVAGVNVTPLVGSASGTSVPIVSSLSA